MKAERYNDISDADLLNRYTTDGNSEWLGILLERYTLLLFGLCMKYFKNEEEAKDGVQQIFLKVISEAGKYKIDYFKSWLYMVAKNYCLMRLRNKQSKLTFEITDQLQIAAEETGPVLDQNEKTYVLLETALQTLCTEQQQCITLFFLEKKSYRQISETTGYTTLQVKSFIQNGKRNLKLLVEKGLRESASKK